MIQLLLKALAVIILGSSGVIMLAYLLQGRMVFVRQKGLLPDAENFKAHELVFDRDGARLHGWLFSTKKAESDEPLVIYYGGNAEELSANLTEFRDRGINNFLMVNYRGYGRSTGVPTEDQLVADALFIIDHMMAQRQYAAERIVLMGRSLGSGVAVKVASLREVGGVILVTPFDSLVNVAKHHYPFLPVNLLLQHRFDSERLAPKVTAPLLALIAGRDEIIPNTNSQKLVKNWAGPLKTLVIPAAGHNDIHLYPEYWQALMSFLEAVKSR